VSLLAVQANWNVFSVYVGSTITFSCHVDNSDKILWHFKPPSAQVTTVYVDKRLSGQFTGRHFVNLSIGNASLTINDVQYCDAGLYECIFLNNDNLSKCEFSLVTIGKYRAFSLTVAIQCRFVSAVAAVSITGIMIFSLLSCWLGMLKSELLNILQ